MKNNYKIVVIYLLFLVIVVKAKRSDIKSDKAIALKSGRLFSNPFGILGHDPCATNLEGRNVTGICYNEVECLLKGGLFAGYCGPPKVEGICCVFSSPKCEKRVTEKIAYFTNPGFPRNDLEPFQCMLSIKPLRDVCWVRFDFEVFELNSDGSGGSCTYDSMAILDSPESPGGRICGSKSGYATIARVPRNKDLKLSVITQGPSYRWNIKITQLKCDQVTKLPSEVKCGIGNINGLSGGGFERSLIGTKRKLRRRKLRKSRKTRSSTTRKTKLSKIPPVIRKKLRNEKFFPSFSARNTFCTSKFRQSKKMNQIRKPPITNIFTTENQQSDDDKVLFKIIDGTEAEINEYPWMVSLQLSGAHFCGGTILSEEWILTAAHCLEFGNIPDFIDRLTISIGDHDLSESSETKNLIRHISKAIIHPWWHNVPGSSGDIALLKLANPVPFSASIKPLCLPTETTDTYAKEIATTVGWGVTETGDPSNVLREVELNIIDNITCFETFNSMDVEIRKDMICTFSGPQGTENICSGDSGSPLMILKDGKFVHVGLTSFSLSDCSAPFPAVYSRTTYYLDWIMAAITNVP